MSASPLRRRIAGIVVATLAAAPVVALTAPGATAATPPPVTSSVDFDYLADVFPALAAERGQHVFETITIERLKYLLRFKSGKYAVLIGDPEDASVQAEIGSINAAAKSIGVQKIYVFNPRIDGNALNVFDWNELATQLGGDGLAYWKAEGAVATTGGPLIDLINGNSPTPEFVRTDGVVSSPYLVVLDKDRTDGEGNDDHVVSSLSDRKTAADLDTAEERAAYEEAVKQTLLDGGTVTTPDLSVNTQFEFYKDEVNRRHNATYATTDADAVKYGRDILGDADGEGGWRVQQLSYPETIDLLSNPRYASSDVPLLFGGTWCHNTRAVIGHLNADAQANGVKTIYNLDFSLFSAGNGGTTYDHIRTSGAPKVLGDKVLAPGHLYGELFNTYLYNAVAEYANDGEPGASPNRYYPGGDTTQPVKTARRLQVPALLVYNPSHKDALGNAAPVVDEAIRTNDDGTYTEYMTEHWFVAGHDLPNTPDTTLNGSYVAGGDRLANARDFATEALDAYADVLGSLGSTHYTSSTSVLVDGQPSTDLVPGTTPTLAISVSAADYAPFITFNKTGADVPRSTATGKPAGYVVVRDADGNQVGNATALKRDGSAVSVTLPAISSDQIGDEWTVTYLGRGYSITPSTTTLRVGKQSSVALTGTTSTSYSTAAAFTATVTAGATGNVWFQGLPGAPVSATIVDGTATFTAPATLPVGTYTVTAAYSGDALYASSVSTPLTLTVKKLTAKATVSAVTSSPYGKAVKVTVKVVDAKGKPATGKVTLSGAGTARTVTLSSGLAAVTLPASLPVKSYTLKATYSGSSTVSATSATRTLKVTQGKVSKVATKVTRIPTTKAYGKATVTVTTASGLALATGKVKVTISRGGLKATETFTLKSGKATFTLPKLPKGTWSISTKYVGSTTYAPATATTVKFKVVK
ncbi:Ig-like domain-containing protein [Cellulomonas edaphi]|uniref:Ig-like domain-containing protein n=1 Tax=Cellulomonas edaphi TaxID=3053468 RepID=A0ABT7S4Q1_9CELL|nr:Ig-like domain-containing protein [Cellulomons edaphi]MDM7830605.1 Ig-like domain-containing protein [Cellulomons edaphi]